MCVIIYIIRQKVKRFNSGTVSQPGNDNKTLGNASKPDTLIPATHTHNVERVLSPK